MVCNHVIPGCLQVEGYQAAGASGGRNDATTAHGGYRKGMAVFTIAKGGLMFEAVLGGQKFSYTPL